MALADPGLPSHQHKLTPARAGCRPRRFQAGKLGQPPDEGLLVGPRAGQRGDRHPGFRGRLPFQLGVLPQDGCLQALKGGAGLDAEPLAQDPLQLLVGAQGFGLAAGAIEGEHAHLPETLPERVGLCDGFELPDQLTMAPTGEVGFQARLEGGQASLFQAGRFGPGRRSLGHVGEGSPPPEAEGLPEGCGCCPMVPLRRLPAALGHQGREADGVDGLGSTCST